MALAGDGNKWGMKGSCHDSLKCNPAPSPLVTPACRRRATLSGNHQFPSPVKPACLPQPPPPLHATLAEAALRC